MLQKFENSNNKEELVAIMRSLWLFYTTDDMQKALVTASILGKLRTLKNKAGDLGVRSKLLLNRWQNEEEGEIEDVELSGKDTDEVCDECGLKYLNKANLKRHTQSVHNKRKVVESTEEPRRTRARGYIG